MTATILIHGGNCTGGVWGRMKPHLDGRVLAVDLPGRNNAPQHARATFAVWARSVVADMDAARIDRAVFVGHSMGGGTLAALAQHFPERVAGVIYFAAVVPPNGGRFLEGLSESQAAYMHRSRDAGLVTLPAAVATPEELADPKMSFVRSAASSEALAPFFERVSLDGLRHTPLGFVKLLRDRSIELSRQELFIERLGMLGHCEVRSVDGGHTAMITRPEESASAIMDLRAAFGTSAPEGRTVLPPDQRG